MKKFKIKRPHLGFNGALEVGIMNIIPSHFIHDIQTINPFVFHLTLVPQNGINMLWDFLFTHKRRADFIKDIFLNVLGVLKPVQINAIHQWVILPSITNRNVKFNNQIFKSFNKILTKKQVWNMTNPFFIPNRTEKKNFLDFKRTSLFHQIGSWRWKLDQPKFPLILFLYKYQSSIVSKSWQLDRVFKIQLGASVLNKIV